MAWSEPDSWLTKLFSGDPLVILFAFLVTVSLPVLLHLYYYTTSAQVSLIPTFLVLGPSGAGKTSLVSLLQRRSVTSEDRETSPTRTSQVPRIVDVTLSPSIPLSSNKYRSKNDTFVQEANQNGTRYRMIDTPGHGKLRLKEALSQLQDPSLRGLIFVVDATTLDNDNPASSRDAAEYLHDILRSLQTRQSTQTKRRQTFQILIAANKQDLFTALPVGAVRSRLQDEIEKVRTSRSRGISEVGKEGEADDDNILVGKDQTKFTFESMDEEISVVVDVIGGAVRGEEAGKGSKRWEEWIGGCL